MAFQDLLYEILVLIANQLDLLPDLNSFSRTNCVTYSLVNPLFYNYDVQKFNSVGLLWAAKHGRADTVQHFICAGASVTPIEYRMSIRTYQGLSIMRVDHSSVLHPDSLHSPLSCAAYYYVQETLVQLLLQLLLQQGADPNFEDAHYHTALTIAAMKGLIPIIQLLLNNKANINQEAKYDGSALVCAI
jgi:ankyrin repeat protein